LKKKPEARCFLSGFGKAHRENPAKEKKPRLFGGGGDIRGEICVLILILEKSDPAGQFRGGGGVWEKKGGSLVFLGRRSFEGYVETCGFVRRGVSRKKGGGEESPFGGVGSRVK